jgi:hypothetical protein
MDLGLDAASGLFDDEAEADAANLALNPSALNHLWVGVELVKLRERVLIKNQDGWKRIKKAIFRMAEKRYFKITRQRVVWILDWLSPRILCPTPRLIAYILRRQQKSDMRVGPPSAA